MSSSNNLIKIALIVLLLVAIGVLGNGLLRQSRLNESSREFAIHVVPLVLSGEPRYQAQEDLEDPVEQEEPPTVAETFSEFAHPSLLQRQSLEDLTKYFYTVTLNLGALQIIESITGSSETPLTQFNSEAPRAAYQLEVGFAGGTATVEIEMLYEQDEWLITTFEVETEMLAD